jgi:5-methylcytosine-specific restriction endonuclease McrA
MAQAHPPLYPDRAPIPADVRRDVLQRAGGRCENCGDAGPLEMHHMTYSWGREGLDLIFGHERPGDLMALCRSCHLGEHLDINGDFWADPDEKEAYWATYFSEMGKD